MTTQTKTKSTGRTVVRCFERDCQKDITDEVQYYEYTKQGTKVYCENCNYNRP